MLTLEEDGSNDHGPCKCCGNMSRTVWGYLSDAGSCLAVYHVHWTLGRVDHGANIDLVIGRWGAQATPEDRSAVAVKSRLLGDEPQFMVADAPNRRDARASSRAATALQRNQAIGTPMAARLFVMLDALPRSTRGGGKSACSRKIIQMREYSVASG